MASFLLVACGGGGDGGGADIRVGRFLDGPVAGLSWETPSGAGLTDDSGAFRYRPGESVDFWIGDVWLGRAEAAPLLTPVDLVPGAATADHPTVTNLARFLQTLDEDGDPGNGIRIPAAVRAAAGGRDIRFSQPLETFPGDPEWAALLDAADAAGAFPGAQRRTLVSAESAAAHLAATLAALAADPGDGGGGDGADGSDGGDSGGGSSGG